MDILREWVVHILVVTLLAFVAQAFMPDKSKKYIKLVMGFITMIVIISPIARSDEILNKLMVQNINATQKKLADQSSDLQFVHQDQVIEVYTQGLQTDIKNRMEKLVPGYSAQVQVILTAGDEFTGEIDAIYITMEQHNVGGVEPVIIDEIKIQPEPSPDEIESDSRFEETRQVIQELYGVEKVSVR